MRLLGDGTVHLLWVLFSSAHCIKPLAAKPTYSYPHNDHTAGPRTCSSSPCQTTCRRRRWLWLFSRCLVTSRFFKASGGLEQRWHDFNFQQSTRCLKSGWQLKLSALLAGSNGKWNKTKRKRPEALEADLKAICLSRGSLLKHFLILATSWPDQAFEFQEVPATLEYLAWRQKKNGECTGIYHSSHPKDTDESPGSCFLDFSHACLFIYSWTVGPGDDHASLSEINLPPLKGTLAFFTHCRMTRSKTWRHLIICCHVKTFLRHWDQTLTTTSDTQAAYFNHPTEFKGER